jgi:hypothetical protein
LRGTILPLCSTPKIICCPSLLNCVLLIPTAASVASNVTGCHVICRTGLSYLYTLIINCFCNINIRSYIVSSAVIVNDSSSSSSALMPIKFSAFISQQFHLFKTSHLNCDKKLHNRSVYILIKGNP